MMGNNTAIEKIRENERKSHVEMYSNDTLYKDGSWLKNPVKTVLELLTYFKDYTQLRVLDLGCGVGRNCIAIGQEFRSISCTIDCVDILDLAIDKLNEYAREYDVSKSIHGIVQSIDEYPIPPNYYDWVIAVSALEHVNSELTFVNKLKEIRSGIKDNGIVCLVINSSIQEFDKLTGNAVPAQFEVNFSTEELQALLNDIFGNWNIMKSTVVKQRYDIPREHGLSDLHTKVITFVAKK